MQGPRESACHHTQVARSATSWPSSSPASRLTRSTLYAPGGVYPRPPACFIAESASSLLSSRVVWNFVNAPLDITAIAQAAALTGLQPSMMTTASYSPNENQFPISLPPSFEASVLITSVRSVGFLTRAAVVAGA